MSWTHNVDKDMIGCMVEEFVPSEELYRNLTARMNALGYTCTVKSVKYAACCLPTNHLSSTSSAFRLPPLHFAPSFRRIHIDFTSRPNI